MTQDKAILEVIDLKKHFVQHSGLFSRKKHVLKALDGISFKVHKGETFGIVGESGCGKSTVAHSIMRLHAISGGKVLICDDDITALSQKELKPYRKKVQMVFQDPYGSLNPRMTVGDIIAEPLDIHKIANNNERQQMIVELLERVGLDKSHAFRYPHEFSGGQRQRVGLARALAVKPECLICDEPVSALDVSVQAQIINMLMRLKKELGLSMVFISHNLSIVRYVSDTIGVMYLGKIVELAPAKRLYDHPNHPYTEALLSALPDLESASNKLRSRLLLKGEVPSPISPPSGCRFRTRCRYSMSICLYSEPELMEVASGHFSACHRNKEIER